MRLLLGLLCSLGMMAAASGAQAQELGTKGNLALSIERAFGLYYDHANIGEDPFDVNRDVIELGLGWQHGATISPLTAPRLGVDYFIDEHLTVGGNLGLAVAGGDGDDVGIIFTGRVGYALRLSHEIMFWPRGGLSVATMNDIFVFAIDLEGMFTFAITDSWAVLAGPVLDLGLTGEAGEADYSEILFGVMVGMTGWFNI